MNTAQASDPFENLGQENWLRFFRKHLSRFLHILVATTVGFQVEDAVVRIARMAVSAETGGDIDHKQGQLRRMRDSHGGTIHAVFQAPVLLSISKVQLDVAPQTVIVHEWCGRQSQSTAAQHALGTGVGAHVGLGDDDDLQGWRALLVEPWHLVQAGLAVPRHGRLFEVWPREVVVSPLGALLAPGTSPSIGTRRGEGQRRIAPQLGNEGQAALACPMQGVGVAKVAIQHQGGHREDGGHPLEQGRQQGGAPPKCRGEHGGRFVGVLAALWPPWTALCRGEFRLLSGGFGLASRLRRVAADALRNAPRKRPPLLDAHQGEREESQPWHRLAVQAGEEPSAARGVLAGLRDDDFIASDDVAIRRTVPMMTQEHPKQHRPREDGGEQALDGTRAAAFAGPAGEAQPRDASSDHPQGQGYPTQAAVGRRWDMRSEALEKCSKVHHGLLRRLRVVVVVDHNSTRDLRQKPYQIANFGEGIAFTKHFEINT
jgi:hypothetical protein